MLDTTNKKTSLSPSPSWALERKLLRFLYHRLGQPAIRIILWDGFQLGSGESNHPGLVLHNRRAFWRLLTNPDLHFGEDYSRGLISTQGELVGFLEAIYRARLGNTRTSNTVSRHLRAGSVKNLGKAKQNAMHHYDIGNDFYRLWLDKDMVYTCAYFAEKDISLEQAQQAKMEHICRKLQLQPGETVYEAGCGWGALAIYMAKHYGVKVKAYNVSHAQIDEATRRARMEGLSDQIEFIEDDYRNIDGHCDVFVSIGMLEHVGQANYQILGQVIDRVLSQTGRGLIHNIAQNQSFPTNPWVLKYIFPQGYTPTLREMMDIFEPYNFSVVDVENLRLHYAITLQHWLQRFDSHSDEIKEMFDENFVRMWRLYLSGSIANFSTGGLQLYQVLFQRPAVSILPLTRQHLYS